MIKLLNLQSYKDEIEQTANLHVVYEDNNEVYSFSYEDEYTTIDKLAKEFINNKDDEGVLEDLIKKYDNKRFAKEILDDYLTINGEINLYGNTLFFDNKKLDNTTSNIIVTELLNNGKIPKKTLLNFLEKLYNNTSSYVRSQFLPWIAYTTQKGNTLFSIAPDGDVLGYKGFYLNEDKEMVSVHSGFAIVNGKEEYGQIRNLPDDIIEMPRDMVEDDPSVGCSTGLHIGTYEYASSFAGSHMMLVKFNPKDIVSVPTECEAQKIRVCKYKVIGRIEEPIKGGFLKTNEDLKALTKDYIIKEYDYDYNPLDYVGYVSDYLYENIESDDLEEEILDNLININDDNYDSIIYFEDKKTLLINSDEHTLVFEDVPNREIIELIKSEDVSEFAENQLYGFYEDRLFKNDLDLLEES